MIVIADMVLAVAEIALAPGAVPELQLRIGKICPSADCAAVGVRCFGGGWRSCTGIVERNRAGFGFWLFTEGPGGIDPPGQGNHIENILAKE